MGENNTLTALKGCGVKMKRKVPVGGFTGLQQLEIKVMPLYLGPVSRSLLCFFSFLKVKDGGFLTFGKASP